MVQYNLMNKLSEDFINKKVKITGICTDLYYKDGGFILPSRFKGKFKLENHQSLIIKDKWLLWGSIFFPPENLEKELNAKILLASGEKMKPVNIYGKLKKNQDYILKVDIVQYPGLYSDFGFERMNELNNLEEFIRDLTPKR